MGRDYWGSISGRIPKFITDELVFTDMCCTFTGYMLRYKDCGCCVYEYDSFGSPKLYTECKYSKNHKDIVQDKDFARWICYRTDINLINEKRRFIEMCIPMKHYVFIDEDHDIKFRNIEALDSLSYETNYKIFQWIILTELILAFDKYRLNDSIIFTQET